MTDLRERVRTILWEESAKGKPQAWEHLTSRPDREMSDLEYMSRFWGFAFGVAYGIARGEDAYESGEDAASRAYEVAHGLFKDDDLHGLDTIRALEAGRAPSGAVAA